MSLPAVLLMMLFAVAPGDATPLVVQASGSPVQLDHASVLTSPEVPPVPLYRATQVSDESVDQFTVIVFVFASEGKRKDREVAPGRRTLETHTTKYSTMGLDGSPIEPTDLLVVGVNQAQRVNSDAWWRADLQAAATEEAAKRKKP